MPEPIQRKLEDQRRTLVSFIEKRKPQGSLKNRVTIVFDGRAGMGSEKNDSRLEVIFSKAESADDTIKKIVAAATNKKNIVVVTGDRGIQYAVRALGAKVCSVKDFLGKATLRAKGPVLKKGPASSAGRQKNISKQLEYKITSEFEDIWVNKKNKK